MKLAIAKYGGLRVAQEESQVVVVGLLLVEVGNQRSPVKCQISQVSVSKSFNQLAVCLTQVGNWNQNWHSIKHR